MISLMPKNFFLDSEHLPVIGDDDEGGDKVGMVVIMSKEIFLDRKHFPCHR